MLPQLLSCAYSYKYLEVLWLPKRTQLWACFNTEPNRLYRRLRLFPSKLQEYTPPSFSRLSTQYHIDPLLACLLSLDTSRTGLRLQRSTKFSNRHTAHGRYEYSYNLANSRENWAQKKKSRPGIEKFGRRLWTGIIPPEVDSTTGSSRYRVHLLTIYCLLPQTAVLVFWI